MRRQHAIPGPDLKRRRLLAGSAALGMAVLTRPAGAAPDQLEAAIREWTEVGGIEWADRVAVAFKLEVVDDLREHQVTDV